MRGLILNGKGAQGSIGLELDDAVLFFFRDGGVLPFYVGAFSAGEGWPFFLKRRYFGGEIVAMTGDSWVVESIQTDGLFGGNFFEKLFSFLNLNWNLVLEVKNSDLQFEVVKEKVLRGLDLDRFWRQFFLDKDVAAVRLRVEDANSVAEIFEVLKIDPNLDEEMQPMLDVL